MPPIISQSQTVRDADRAESVRKQCEQSCGRLPGALPIGYSLAVPGCLSLGKENYIDHGVAEQKSRMFDFTKGRPAPPLILDPNIGKVAESHDWKNIKPSNQAGFSHWPNPKNFDNPVAIEWLQSPPAWEPFRLRDSKDTGHGLDLGCGKDCGAVAC